MGTAVDPTRIGSTPSDVDLIDRLRRGDRTAFHLAFKRHASRAHAIALSVLRDRDLAEDVVQETFLAMLTQAGDLDPTLGSLATWLNTVAHRRAVDRVRRETVRRSAISRAAAMNHDGAGWDPSDAVIEEIDASEQRNRVREALAALPEPQRDVMRRMYFRGQTCSQIAGELRVPLGTVKSRARLAMLRLRHVLPTPSTA